MTSNNSKNLEKRAGEIDELLRQNIQGLSLKEALNWSLDNLSNFTDLAVAGVIIANLSKVEERKTLTRFSNLNFFFNNFGMTHKHFSELFYLIDILGNQGKDYSMIEATAYLGENAPDKRIALFWGYMLYTMTNE